MSDYRYMRVIRCKVDLDKISVSSLWDLEDKFTDLFDMNQTHQKIFPGSQSKIDDNGGDWGRSRYITENEANKYLVLFSEIYPDVKRDDLRAVEFCWYDCSEAPLYYDVDEEEWL